MVFLLCVSLIHHVWHIRLRGRRPECLAVVPHVPRSSARGANLGVVEWRLTGTVGYSGSPFAGQWRRRHRWWLGTDGQVGVEVALESAWCRAGACRASVRSTLGLRR